jgi:hypothetical protein
VSAVHYEWRTRADDPGHRYLFRDGRQIGGWDSKGRYYRPYDAVADSWGDVTHAPFAPPDEPCDCSSRCACEHNCFCPSGKLCTDACRCLVPSTGDMPVEENYGIDREKLNREPRRTIQATAIPDDTKKLRLTLIGADADRKPIESDLASHPLLTPLKDQFVLWSKAPDHSSVKNVGFVTAGHPSIYVQSADGKVLHRQDSYRGPEQLAEAIRKANPNYDPKNDPDLTKKPAPAPTPEADDVPVWPLSLGNLLTGVASLVLLLKGKK